MTGQLGLGDEALIFGDGEDGGMLILKPGGPRILLFLRTAPFGPFSIKG